MNFLRQALIVAGLMLVVSSCTNDSYTGASSSPPPPPLDYTISGSVSGLVGYDTVTLFTNDESITLGNVSSQVFFTLPENTLYDIQVINDEKYACTVDNANGTLTADVNDVVVDCISQVTTLAGPPCSPDGLSCPNPSRGYVNGTLEEARFDSPEGILMDSDGIIYVVDNNAIRKIDVVNNEVSTITGPGVGCTTACVTERGYVNGTLEEARFNSPNFMVMDSNGIIYLAEVDNAAIRKIDIANNEVTTLAGAGVGCTTECDGDSGYVNGTLSEARFYLPGGIVMPNDDIIYMSESNGTIRKIDIANNEVSTLAGIGVGCTTDCNASNGYANGTLVESRFYSPGGMVIPTDDIIYVADGNNAIRKVDINNNEVSTIAGAGIGCTTDCPPYYEVDGYINGTLSEARFNSPEGMVMDSDGIIYVADGNHALRKVDIANNEVSTLVGAGVGCTTECVGIPGYINGTLSEARFNSPKGIVIDITGITYVTDGNHAIRRIFQPIAVLDLNTNIPYPSHQ